MEKELSFRPSTLEERKEFYEKEFSLKKVKMWFKSHNLPLPQLCALDAGSETKIIMNKKWKGSMFYFPFKELAKKIKKYCPEDVYYDRNTYKNPKQVLKTLNFNNWLKQGLVFDIDLENMSKEVNNKNLVKLYAIAVKMKNLLEKDFNKVSIVYSGRGFHIHVLDKKAFFLNIKERENLNKKFSNFPIDPWVSQGHIRLIRMPYSLHGIVSRKCIPIKTKFKFKETIPKFLKNEISRSKI